jgi:hypothetical protein
MTLFQTAERNIYCPYCGESIDVIIDCSVQRQEYIEDCQVCCRPIEFHVEVDEDGEPSVSVSSEND